jgi:hypothetical protein
LQIALHMGDWPKAAEMEVEVEGDDRRSDDRPPVRGRKRRGAVAGCSTDGNGTVVVGTPAAREVGRAGHLPIQVFLTYSSTVVCVSVWDTGHRWKYGRLVAPTELLASGRQIGY